MPKGVYKHRTGYKLPGDYHGKSNHNFRHGLCLTREGKRLLYVFSDAKSRCSNPNHKRYADYGGRGIRFCFPNVAAFLAELGPKPQDGQRYTVDRVDNSGNYEPGNIQWATYRQQANNRRKGSGWWGSHAK